MPITPTVGRVVHYWPSEQAIRDRKAQPYAAIITHVWGDDCVNLSVLQDGSYPTNDTTPTSVSRIDTGVSATCQCWAWMPFQQGQAAKTEDATGKLAERISRIESHIGFNAGHTT